MARNVNQSFITGGANPSGVAIDGSHIYWANVTQRHDRAGRPRRQNVNQNFITGLDLPDGVAVDGSHIYWANARAPARSGALTSTGQNVNQSFITERAPLRGSGRRRATSTGQQPYWAYQPDDAIGRADLDGLEP